MPNIHCGLNGVFSLARIRFLLENQIGSIEDQKNWTLQALKILRLYGCLPTGPQRNEDIIVRSCRAHFINVNTGILGEGVPEKHFNMDTELVKKIISQDYLGSIYFVEKNQVNRSQYYYNLELIIKLSVLGRNFKSVEDLQYKIQNINISTDLKSNEIGSLRRIRILICASYFLQRRYFDCCSLFFRYLTMDPDLIVSSVFNESDNPLIFEKEFLIMVTISIITSIPMEHYEDFIYLPEANLFFVRYPIAIKCLNYLLNTKFKMFFAVWNNEINQQCLMSPYLRSVWFDSQKLTRLKICFLYLRVSNKIQISYLSERLGIEYSVVKEDITELINAAKLNIEVNGDTLVHEEKSLINEVIEGLNDNEANIATLLNIRKKTNLQLKDSIQNTIVTNRNSLPDTFLNEIANSNDSISYDYSDSDTASL